MNLAAAPHVIVAGGGPGGLSLASLLRAGGAVVTLVDENPAGVVNEARRASVVVNREAWDVLRRVGGADALEDPLNVVNATQQQISLRRLDTDLGTHAAAAGVDILRGRRVESVEELGGKGVLVGTHDAVTGARTTLQGDLFVDAAAGRSPLAADARFARVDARGPRDLHGTATRSFIGVRVAADPARGVGWTGERGSFAINNRTEGVATAYRGMADTPTMAQARAQATQLLRDLKLEAGAQTPQPFVVTTRQSIAPHAAAGRLLLVGDSVGSMFPSEQMGTSLALTDAERAADTILTAHRAGLDTPEAAALIERYDTDTTMIHRAFIR